MNIRIYLSLIVAATFSVAAAQSAEGLSEAQLDSIENAVYGETHDLQEIVVSADAPVIKVEGNLVSYNVANDPTASGQSALDMLRKVPMIAVDGQDNITLKGESNFKIYVNGRPEPMLSENASTILKAMPASAISKVEVIADPGAKYDAEGAGGIINLVTERSRRESGYNGSVTASLSNREIMAGVFGAAKWGPVTLNANVNYMNSRMFDQSGSYFSSTSYRDGRELISNADTPRNFDFAGISLSGSWEASAADLLNFSINYNDVNGTMKILDNYTSMSSADGIEFWSYRRNAHLDMSMGNLTANAAWQHNFSRPDNYLALSYQFDYGTSSTPMTETYYAPLNYPLQYPDHSTSNDNYNRSHTIQLDYSNTLSPHALIETGAKAILRHNNAISSGENTDPDGNIIPSGTDHTNLAQIQNIYALYMLYKATYGAWSADAGLRYEHTRMGIRYHYGAINDFTNYLNDVVPNAGVTYSFSPTHALGLSYSMRISRPSLEQVNPFSVKYRDTEITRGNPDLQSERINKISLSYRNFGRLIGTSLSLDYSHTGNAISAYSFLEGPVVIQTNANIGRKQYAGLTAFLLINAHRNLRLTFNGTGGYTHLRADGAINIRNHGWNGNISHNGEWTLPAEIVFSWYGGYNWGSIGLQNRSGDFYYYGLAFARDFLADKSLRITLNAGNFAQKKLKFSNTTITPDFTSTTIYRIAAWRIGVSLTWKFGKTQSVVKNVNTTINNDDISHSGASSAASRATSTGL